jgi:hypothetical protein
MHSESRTLGFRVTVTVTVGNLIAIPYYRNYLYSTLSLPYMIGFKNIVLVTYAYAYAPMKRLGTSFGLWSLVLASLGKYPLLLISQHTSGRVRCRLRPAEARQSKGNRKQIRD